MGRRGRVQGSQLGRVDWQDEVAGRWSRRRKRHERSGKAMNEDDGAPDAARDPRLWPSQSPVTRLCKASGPRGLEGMARGARGQGLGDGGRRNTKMRTESRGRAAGGGPRAPGKAAAAYLCAANWRLGGRVQRVRMRPSAQPVGPSGALLLRPRSRRMHGEDPSCLGLKLIPIASSSRQAGRRWDLERIDHIARLGKTSADHDHGVAHFFKPGRASVIWSINLCQRTIGEGPRGGYYRPLAVAPARSPTAVRHGGLDRRRLRTAASGKPCSALVSLRGVTVPARFARLPLGLLRCRFTGSTPNAHPAAGRQAGRQADTLNESRWADCHNRFIRGAAAVTPCYRRHMPTVVTDNASLCQKHVDLLRRRWLLCRCELKSRTKAVPAQPRPVLGLPVVIQPVRCCPVSSQCAPPCSALDLAVMAKQHLAVLLTAADRPARQPTQYNASRTLPYIRHQHLLDLRWPVYSTEMSMFGFRAAAPPKPTQPDACALSRTKATESGRVLVRSWSLFSELGLDGASCSSSCTSQCYRTSLRAGYR
ncbi:uncharacterized protein PSFLO_00589 [Pseudozyma flocculosa]|uniref:Uncharacterized protein n=1 Tax=Pseudozyma flocculosa TaxID=84751 RepID=A0A5C3ES95_9BASI|nr:uncharacterized protein PSFLO_00589 [Pseudozyma flocculosa]